MTYEIEDQTPANDTMLNVSYKNAMGKSTIENFWYTHQQGASIQWKNGKILLENNGKPKLQRDKRNYSEYYVGDFVNLALKTRMSPSSSGDLSEVTLYPYSLGHTTGDPRDSWGYYGGELLNTNGWPYSWGNWAVHYNENITIKNNSSSQKTVKYTILQRTSSLSQDETSQALYGSGSQNIVIKSNNSVGCNNNNSGRTVSAIPANMGNSAYHMVYNAGKSSEYCIDYYPSTYANSNLTYHIITVTVEPNSSKTISLTSNLGGMSSGLITKWLSLSN